MSGNNILILSGGRIEEDFALSFLESRSYQKIIAVDGGLEFLDRIGLLPTDIVGDFDTVEKGLLEKYEGLENISVHRFPPEKDDTDSEIAVKLALEYGGAQIDILGASGTRLDHTLGNIRLLGLIHRYGSMPGRKTVKAYLYDKNNRVRLVEGECVIRREEAYGSYISLLPFTQRVEGITLSGFRYPLTDAAMDVLETPTLGISNEIAGEQGKIFARKGLLLVIEAKD